MKLQAEIKPTLEKVMPFFERIKPHALYLSTDDSVKNLEIRLAYDVLRSAIGSQGICDLYKKYDCNDSHVETLALKVLRMVFDVQKMDYIISNPNAEPSKQDFKPTKQEMEIARKLKNQLQGEHDKSHAFQVKQAEIFGEKYAEKCQKVKSSLKDIALLVRCVENGEYNPVFESKMYKQYGNEYCHFLQWVKEFLAEQNKSNDVYTDLEKLERILQDKNVTEEGKERKYDEFVSKYPYFNTSRLDKYFI